MAYRQPRVPPLNEDAPPMDALRETLRFLRDFSIETWTAVTALGRQVGALVCGVSRVNGRQGDVALTLPDVAFMGVNPVADAQQDTPMTWNRLGAGYAVYNAAGMLREQPSRYGFLITFVRSADIFQIWHTQSGGPAYVRSGNGQGWNGSWRQIWDSTHPPAARDLLDTLYPIGAVYAAAMEGSPAARLGGEWAPMADNGDGVWRYQRVN